MQCRFCTRNPKYLIFADGSVYSIFSQKMMSPGKSSSGYLHVTLCNNGKMETVMNHRLVAEAFIPNPLNLPEIDHINGDKTDNRVENLEWVSSKENQQRAVKNKLHTFESVSKRVAKYTVSGDLVAIYPSARCAARENNTSKVNISSACSGAQGRKTALGFIWKYV